MLFNQFHACATDFATFLKEVKVSNPYKNEWIKPEFYHYHQKLFQHLEHNNKTILLHPRQRGYSSFIRHYSLWNCMFKENESYYLVDCNYFHYLLDTINHMSAWLKPAVRVRDTSIYFLDSNSSIHCDNLQNIRGKNFTHLIVDNAGFIPDLRWQLLSTYHRITLLSSVGVKNDYLTEVKKAQQSKSDYTYPCLSYH